MGNAGRKEIGPNNLTKDEYQMVSLSFKYLSRNSSKIKDDDLLKAWNTQVDAKLVQGICNFFFTSGDNRSRVLDFEKYAQLFEYAVRGTTDERVAVFLKSFGKENEEEIPYACVKEYTESIVSSYIKVLQLQNSPGYYSWIRQGFSMYKECILRMAESLAAIAGVPTSGFKQHDISKWFNYNPSMIKMLSHIFLHLYEFTGKEGTKKKEAARLKMLASEDPAARDLSGTLTGTHRVGTDMIPVCAGLQYVPDFPCFIDIVQLLFISSNLPFQAQKEWRFLFSSQIHGDSFNTLLGRIIEQGPSVIIIEDADGYIFGGYAAESWVVGPKFLGNDSNFLFTINPKMRVYSATSYNDHYQYLNIFQQTMPNGIGMGGQLGFWGLWISNDFGVGQSSESCTTFKDYKQLSKQKDFKIKNIEVWAVEDVPLTDEELGIRLLNTDRGKSILSGNAINRALLEIAGKPQHSAGMKEMDRQIELETKVARGSPAGARRKTSEPSAKKSNETEDTIEEE